MFHSWITPSSYLKINISYSYVMVLIYHSKKKITEHILWHLSNAICLCMSYSTWRLYITAKRIYLWCDITCIWHIYMSHWDFIFLYHIVAIPDLYLILLYPFISIQTTSCHDELLMYRNHKEHHYHHQLTWSMLISIKIKIWLPKVFTYIYISDTLLYIYVCNYK
jgi:hypothetical protein